MRKFTIRNIKGTTTIYELEVDVITGIEDPSIMWLNPGEYKVRVLKPELFHLKVEKKDADGKKVSVLEPDVWCWHDVYDNYNDALFDCIKLIESEFEFRKRKYGEVYTNVDVAAAMLSIAFVKIPGSDFETDAHKIIQLQKDYESGKLSLEEVNLRIQSLKNLKS